ncbi:hypothetical protein P7C71_g6507, partial [Lecanoromycetidae sp. Uapishka_2]
MASNTTHPGVLHRISRPSSNDLAPPLVAFEHGITSQSQNDNTLIFLGGLSDGLLTVPFVPPIVEALPSSWRLVEPILSSAYHQWGFASLGQDIVEIAVLVEYFRTLRKGKIVLLGHSTGSQQIMHYLLSLPPSPKIDGATMQGSISDREAMVAELAPSIYSSTCALAQTLVDEGRGSDILPATATVSMFMSAPVSANRWLSLASPDHAGEDDYFSSDLPDETLERTFGFIGIGKQDN